MNIQPVPMTAATLWSRLKTTPLFDLLRGRLTGSLDMRGVIAAAALPEPLGDLIRSVARRTRLWRIERVDVARELVGHFRDGVAAGRTPEELVESFGDPRQAARLIRRAKLRSRPRFWRVWRRGVQVLGSVAALSFGCLLFLAIRFYANHPTIAHNYGLDLIAPTEGVPEADRAWPFYREALLRITPDPLVIDEDSTPPADGSAGPGGEEPGDNSEPEADPNAALTPLIVQAERPGSKHWNKVERWLDENQDVLDLTRQGGARPRLGFVYNDPADVAWLTRQHMDLKSLDPNKNAPMVTFLLPQYQESRRLQLLLEADARRALFAGDRKAFVGDVAALIGMAEQMRSDLAFLIVDLISYNAFGRALILIDEALSGHTEVLDEEDLAHLAHRVASYAGGGPIIPRLAGERASHRDFIQRSYSDDGHGDGVFTVEGLRLLEKWGGFRLIYLPKEQLAELAICLPLAGGVMPRKELIERANALYDRAEAEFQLPLWQWNADDFESAVNRMKGSAIERIRYAPLLVLMPGTTSCYATAQWWTQERDATLVALALTLFHRRHGAWPERLEQLVPDLLPTVPPDRFTGQPLRYRVVEGRPVLYSVGPDNEDQGGQGPDLPAGELESLYRSSIYRRSSHPGAVPEKSDVGWDWVLWRPLPQPAEKPPAAGAPQ